MVTIEVTDKLAEVIKNLSNKDSYFEVSAFVANALGAAIEARCSLTPEQAWDLFTAVQEYKVLIDELADCQNWLPPRSLGIFKEQEPGNIHG